MPLMAHASTARRKGIELTNAQTKRLLKATVQHQAMGEESQGSAALASIARRKAIGQKTVGRRKKTRVRGLKAIARSQNVARQR